MPEAEQDGRHDLPTIGPATAERAKRAGLAGVAAEAGRAILVGRDETIEAFRRAGLFLAGLDRCQARAWLSARFASRSSSARNRATSSARA